MSTSFCIRNRIAKQTFAIAITTVTTAVATLATLEPAQAFLITRSNGPTGSPLISTPPTVIDFNSFVNNTPVPTTATPIGPGGSNGGATIQNTAGTAQYQGNRLFIGGNNNATGTVSFVFDDPRGMGYIGFQWQNPKINESISFFSGNTLIQTLTGTQVVDNAFGAGNYFNFFVTNNSEIFNRIDLVRAAANGNAFEIDDLAYQAIPTPALLPGLVAMGIGMLRKRNQEEVAVR